MHGGDLTRLAARSGRSPHDIVDFSANINPLGPPPSLRRAITRALDRLDHYPEPEAATLTAAIAARLGLAPEQVAAANGTAELLCVVPRLLKPAGVLLPVPCYIDYERVCRQAGLAVRFFPLPAEEDFRLDPAALAARLRPGDLVILGQPNNPTGRLVEKGPLRDLILARPDVMFLVDEAFAGFVPGYRSLVGSADNLLTTVSLTKLYAIPGLRLGYLAGPVPLVQALRRELPPWNVNVLAQEAGLALLDEEDYLARTRAQVTSLREAMQAALAQLPGLRVIPGTANFLLLRLDHPRLDAADLARRLIEGYGLAIRVCDDYQGLDRHYFRVAVRSAEDNGRLRDALELELAPASRPRQVPRPRRPPALMLAGTGSDVGKSVLTAALCRIFLQEGYRVAPFKAQNMSLNSHVTRDGGEMGRAQAVQAQACRLDPDVRMNPVLLKPSSATGSQVIIRGQPRGTLSVRQYIDAKTEAWHEVQRAYDELAADFDLMVLEGAGSTGEVNLRAHDIVNLRMAEHAAAQVLLVGDIDRGGVYASFVGHIEVMEPWERRLVRGFLVNRFRGDASLLAPAHDYLRQRTGLPVLGVVPYLADLALPQEDSVAFRAGVYARPPADVAQVEIAVIDLPYISNFTDLEPLLIEPDVHLRVVREPAQLGRPAAVILPGSKNVIHDLDWLRQSGVAAALAALVAQGVELVGICGGYQMLGRGIDDPLGLEAARPGTSVAGLDFLSLRTELAAEKTLTQRQGRHLPSGAAVCGYEIHHGRSRDDDGEPLLRFDTDETCGSASGDGLVWGSYLHGIFDSDTFRRWWIDRLRRRQGLAPVGRILAAYDIEPVLDQLAERVRAAVDMRAIRRMLGLAP
ncbi:MAG: threonine-phosphate decarboxylase [Desulfobulbaceae bacterium A2]|nr:MAG: threonine-phosphate decarboxylase [Desulfobulbaceae bacterium A2]